MVVARMSTINTKGTIDHRASGFLQQQGRIRNILRPFQEAGFDVTWANQRVYQGTQIAVCFLRPSADLCDAYGFDYEVIFVYSKYSAVEPRTLRAVDHVFSTDPAKGRVEPMLFFLVAEAQGTPQWVASYLAEHRESRIVVPFSASEIAEPSANQWTVRNQLHQHFMMLDRFKYTLPLKEDTYFFGRTGEVGQILDLLRRSENAGIFGLRKTGKTSILLRLRRLLEGEQKHAVEIFDAQEPDVRKRNWHELLEYVANILLKRIGRERTDRFTEINATKLFRETIKSFLSHTNWNGLTIAFDEIEWLTPQTARDRHWDEQFLEFWQVIRSVQTDTPRFSIIVAGVNPAVAEESRFGAHQNPLFGIITPIFLRGLVDGETKELVQKIGKIMGLNFAEDAVAYLIDQYAGHPLLTRLACSNCAELAKMSGEQFPIRVSKSRLEKEKTLRDTELIFYVRHVVDELERFYPKEYGLLEQLALGDYQGFKAASPGSQSAAHLFRYGIVSNPEYPFITYAVVRDYVALENARREGRPWRYKLVAEVERTQFLHLRLKDIAEDLRDLERLIKLHNLPLLFGPNSFPEADRLVQISVPHDQDSLGAALSILNRCLVESIERYGNSIGNRNYFWSVIKDQYVDLHQALHRVKVYRHNSHHLELLPGVEEVLRKFLELDLDDAIAGSTERYWWILQRSLDELFQSIQRESSKLELRSNPT